MNKTHTFWISSLCIISFSILLLNSCKKTNVIADDDSELIGEVVDSILPGNGEIHPNIDRIVGNTTRAKLVNRCIWVWENMNTTKYVFNADKVIDDENGIYKFDCSGFVSEIIIDYALPAHHSDLINNMRPVIDIDGDYINVERPLVAHMYDYFTDEILKDKAEAQNKYWKVFLSIDSLQKGDLIVSRYDDSWRVSNKNSTTGHIMIAWEIISKGSNNEITIQVLDAAASAHTANEDTRTMNPHPIAELRNGKKSGIGFGLMTYKISTDGSRKLHAYKWSTTSTYFYNLLVGDDITYESNQVKRTYDRLEGIVFARPI